jgi:hypothetical protein
MKILFLVDKAQSVKLMNGEDSFEVGNYLGGGVAGTVYEAEYSRTRENFALKILTPLVYKITNPSTLRKYAHVTKGANYDEEAGISITKEHVWWVLNSSTRQYFAAYFSERERGLKELSLRQCVQVWGLDHDCR